MAWKAKPAPKMKRPVPAPAGNSNNPYWSRVVPIVKEAVKNAFDKHQKGNGEYGTKQTTKIEGVPQALAVTKKGTASSGPGGATAMTFTGNELRVRQRKYVGTIQNHVTDAKATPPDPGGARLESTDGNTYFVAPSQDEGDAMGIFPVVSGLYTGHSVTAWKSTALFDESSFMSSVAAFFEFWKPECITLIYEPEANTSQHGMIGIAWTPQLQQEFTRVDTSSSNSPWSNDYLTMSSCPRFGSANLYMPLTVTAHPLKSGIADSGRGWLRTGTGETADVTFYPSDIFSHAGCWIINVDEPAETELYGRLHLDVTYVFKGCRGGPQASVGYLFLKKTPTDRLHILIKKFVQRETMHYLHKTAKPITKEVYEENFRRIYNNLTLCDLEPLHSTHAKRVM